MRLRGLADRAGVKVLKLPFNLGYGAAVQTGLIYGVEYGYDLCVLIDGDGQHDPQYIADLIAPSKRGRRTSRSARAFWAKLITRYRWPASWHSAIQAACLRDHQTTDHRPDFGLSSDQPAIDEVFRKR